MQSEDRKVLTFALTVCIVCSLLLSATAAILRERQEVNKENDLRMNILSAFGVDVRPEGKKISGEKIKEYFDAHISEIVLDRDGNVLEGLKIADISIDDLEAKTKLPLFTWKEGDEITMYAFAMSGYGLWSTVYSYMALEKDLATIKGVTFYGHKETPGLGGECSAPWFMEQFVGKKIWADGKALEFEVVKGGVATKYPNGNDHGVDGMSAATITGNGIQDFIRSDFAMYEKYFQKVRGK